MNFKELSFKKKLEHIWEYYRLMIFGVLFVVIAGGSLTYAMFIKERPVSYGGVGIYNSYITAEQSAELTSRLNSALGLASPETVTVTNYYFDENDKLFNVDMEQKFVTYLFSLEMHAVAAPRADMEMFVSAEYIAPLTDYYTEAELEKISGRLIYLPDPLDGNREKPFAISLEGSALCEDIGIFDNCSLPDRCVGIIPVEGCRDNTRALIDELIREPVSAN